MGILMIQSASHIHCLKLMFIDVQIHDSAEHP